MQLELIRCALFHPVTTRVSIIARKHPMKVPKMSPPYFGCFWGPWPSGLERWTGDLVVLGSNPAEATSLRIFGNSVYPALPVSFGGDTNSHRSLLSGVYSRGSKAVFTPVPVRVPVPFRSRSTRSCSVHTCTN